MAPSPVYYVWSADGKPYALMRPARAVQATLRRRGLTVYDYPDRSHLEADTPEDHTPFSATGWPVKSAYGIGHALDIMPRNGNAAGRAENAAIARQLIKDRNAGHPGAAWIKYINWTDEQGVCRQERWMPTHVTRSSTDRNHIHVSGRSDCDAYAGADTYDPVARMLGIDGGIFMALSDQQQQDLWEWLALLVDPGAPMGGRPGDRFKFPPPLKLIMQQLTASAQREADMLTAITTLANAGTSVDTAVVVAAINARTSDLMGVVQSLQAENAALRAQLSAEVRDAVADLGEGGAAKVRGPQG